MPFNSCCYDKTPVLLKALIKYFQNNNLILVMFTGNLVT